MKKLMLWTAFFFLSGLNADCIEDLGTPNMFGSYDQLKHIKKEIKTNGCDFIQITWNNKTYQGDLARRMIALDVVEGIMIRAMLMPYSKPSWEFWYDFDESTIINDDPSDGFDLPNYTTSFDKSRLSKELNKAFKKFK
mgnify:CR=1 FL=1